MSLREKQMAQRRARILATAKKLIRKTGGTDFTMNALAREAEVSPATPFNIFGTKEALLYELLLLSLRDFFSRAETLQSDDPIERVVSAAQAAVDVFVDNPKQLRPLYRFLLGVVDPESRPAFLRQSQGYWRNSLDAAVSSGMISDNEANAIALSLLAHILGILELWVHHDISDEAFRCQLILGALMHLAPFVRTRKNAEHRLRIQQILQEIEPELQHD